MGALLRRITVSVGLGICCLAMPASGSPYPFRIVSSLAGNAQYSVVAQNDGPAPVTVRVTVSGENVASDRAWPIVVTVPRFSSINLARLYPANPLAFQLQFTLNSTIGLGDIAAVHDPRVAYRLPFEDGKTLPITQAYGGPLTTHTTAESQFAVDFTMPQGTPIVAARDGVVIDVTLDNEYGGKEEGLLTKANHVMLLHTDGTIAVYAHLASGQPIVRRGDSVMAGTRIGYSGSTGFSSGPHLHFAVLRLAMTPDGSFTHQSLPTTFYAYNPPVNFYPKAGVLVTAEYRRPAAPSAAEQAVPPAAIFKQPAVTTSNTGVVLSVDTQSIRELAQAIGLSPSLQNDLASVHWGLWVMIGGAVCLVLIGVFGGSSRRAIGDIRYGKREPTFGPNRANTVRGKLLLACGGDRERVQRLIDFETSRSPLLSDDEAAQRALDRLERDRRA